MKNILAKLKTYDSLFLASMVLCGIWQVLRCPDLPGLYLDAVNPDYLAVQILFPQTPNRNWAIPYSSIPLLGQLYHGTITIWLQLLIIGLFGKANLLTLRLANMIYVIGICWIMYLILKKTGANKIISFLMMDAIILSPNVFSFIRTQYYIKLPGTLLLMLSVYFAILSIDRQRHALYLALSGISLGVAFYSYFIFLFFAPAVLVLCLGKTRQLGLKRFKDAFIWCAGFGCGGILYVIGYSDFVITSTNLNPSVKKTLVVAVGILLLIMMLILVCTLVKKYQSDKIFYRCCLAAFLMILIFAVIVCANLHYVTDALLPNLSSLKIAGTSMGFMQRIAQIFYFWTGVMNNRFMEWIMLDTVSSFLPDMLVFLFLFVFGIACILTIAKKMDRSDWREILVWSGLLLCFGVFSIPFSSRMGGQHFTPTFFVTCMIFTLLLDRVWQKSSNHHIKRISPLLLGTFFLWCVINSNLLQQNLEFTGGKNMYSENINILAENALCEKKAGQNTVYVFPEWGFMCGFNYITMNQIPYMLSVDTNLLEQYLDKGYQFKVCAWDRENIEQYIELLNNAGITDLSLDTVQSREGEIVFYIIQGA